MLLVSESKVNDGLNIVQLCYGKKAFFMFKGKKFISQMVLIGILSDYFSYENVSGPFKLP